MSKIVKLKKISGRTAQETAYFSIRRAAMIGTFKPGQPLTIRGLATNLGMSITPIREALRQLCAEHALLVLENRRIVIPELSHERYEELVALRVSLETHAALRALPYINDKKITEIEQLDLEADKALEKAEHDVVVIANQKFHAAIYKTNPEQIIMPMIESVWLQIGPILKIAAINAYQPDTDYHKEMVSALKTRDARKLIEALELDIRQTKLP